jgi:peptide/nickel transport system permease protein
MSARDQKLIEFFNNKAAALGLFTILILALIALLANIISPYDPNLINLEKSLNAPSPDHLMGTDQLGRDLLSRIIHGTRITFEVSLVTAIITCLLGVTIGILAGYYGGLLDELLMRVADILLAFPQILFTLIIVGGMGAGVVNTILAITITGWLTYARVSRASTLSLREKGFIEGARAMGFNDSYICVRYIFLTAFHRSSCYSR